MERYTDVFDSVYIVAFIGAGLVFIASIALAIMMFIFNSVVKEDISQRRKGIVLGIAILLVGFCGSGFLIYLGIMFK